MKGDRFYIPVADGMRALSIAIIALYHFWQQSWAEIAFSLFGRRYSLLPMLSTGYLFVDIMLMLSGFLLYMPYARAYADRLPHPSVSVFYKKRAARILPGYLLAVFVPLFVFAIPQGKYADFSDVAGDVLPYLTFTQTFFPKVYQGSRLNAVLWTVGVEAQAYILFPLAAKAFTRKPVLMYGCMTLAGFAYRFAIWKAIPDLTLWINQLPSFLDVYANGMLAAYLLVRYVGRESEHGGVWIPILCTIGACACLFGIWRIICWQSAHSWQREGLHFGQALMRFPLTALGAVWLLLASRSAGWFRAIFGNAAMRWFSGISYAFYIWHQLLAVKLRVDWRFPPYKAAENPQFASEQPWQWQYMIACMLAATVAAALVTYAVERPASRRLIKVSLK